MKKLPVALFVFNRPNYSKKVIDRIKEYGPEKLYVFCDGPREKKTKEDSKNINEIRAYIEKSNFSSIEYKFSKDNLGCKKSIIGGLNHFFEEEEFGIILEDDCVPVPAFFKMCEHAKLNYSNADNVQLVSGTNYLFQEYKSDEHYLSKLGVIWGWATWSHIWNGVTNNFEGIDKKDLLNQINNWYKHEGYASFIYKMIEGVIDGKLDAWSLYFLYDQIKNERYSLVSSNNLISNIGEEGTHGGFKSPFIKMPTKDHFIFDQKMKNNQNENFDQKGMTNIIEKEYQAYADMNKYTIFDRIKDSIKYRILKK